MIRQSIREKYYIGKVFMLMEMKREVELMLQVMSDDCQMAIMFLIDCSALWIFEILSVISHYY